MFCVVWIRRQNWNLSHWVVWIFLKQDILQIINDLPWQLMHSGHFCVNLSKNKTEDFSPLNLWNMIQFQKKMYNIHMLYLVIVSCNNYLTSSSCKVHIFWEGHKILRNLHLRFDGYYLGQVYGGNFGKICGLLRIYEL